VALRPSSRFHLTRSAIREAGGVGARGSVHSRHRERLGSCHLLFRPRPRRFDGLRRVDVLLFVRHARRPLASGHLGWPLASSPARRLNSLRRLDVLLFVRHARRPLASGHLGWPLASSPARRLNGLRRADILSFVRHARRRLASGHEQLATLPLSASVSEHCRRSRVRRSRAAGWSAGSCCGR
jgi:hypothetical protein